MYHVCVCVIVCVSCMRVCVGVDADRVQAVPTVGDALEMDAIDPNADQDIPEEMPLGPRKSQTKAGPAPGRMV